MTSTYNLTAHALPGRTFNPYPKPVNKCAQCSVSGQSSQ